MGERDIKRLLVPRSLALIGGAWADAVEAGNRAIGYTGQLWRVHPTRPSTASTTYYRCVADLPASPDAAFVAVPSREVATVVAALRELPARQREAVVLRYYGNLSESDIACAMGISKGAVKSHTARAMAALRTALQQYT